MIFKPEECKGCVLYNDQLESNKIKDKTSYEKAHAGRGFSQPDGGGTGGVVVFLESLGDNEVDDGLPVRPHAPAGSIFERVINRSPGLTRDMFRIYNTIQCQPPWNKLSGTPWQFGAIDHCQTHRQKFLESIPLQGTNYKQRIILALGAVPFKTLTGLEGEYLNLTDIRGYPIETPYGIVIGSYHPSHILQGAQKLMGVLMLDMRMAAYLAKNGFVKKPLDYQENPSLIDARVFYHKVKDNPNLALAYDIETPNVEKGKRVSEIESIQFSLGPQTGIFFPWFGEYIEIAREILALKNEKIGHNVWRFDNPVLKEVGKVEFGGETHDTFWAFHHYQPDLTIEDKDGEDAGISSRMGLQFVASFFGMDFPWKHFKFDKSQAKTYGIADVDATQRIWTKLPQAMKRLGVWDGYYKLRFKLDPVLVRMTERGIPVVEAKRIALREEILIDKQKHFEQMQQFVPDELKNVDPKKGFDPKRPIENQIAFKKGLIQKDGEVNYVWYDRDLETWFPVVKRDFGPELGLRYARLEPFKPSNDQLIRYMKFKGYKIPKKKVKDDRQVVDTAEQKELIKSYRSTKDPLFLEVLGYRGCETADSRYVQKWIPDENGLVHPQFMYVPATGQLNSVRPNAQNFIKHGAKDGVDRKYAQRLRSMIEAPAGYKIVEFDYKSFHALTTGFEARDPDYMRLARLDIHSFVTAHFVYIQKLISASELPDLSWSDSDLTLCLESIKQRFGQIRDTKAKPADLGYGFGMGPNKLYQQNEDTMTLKDAKMLMKLLDDLFPIAKEWRKAIKVLADRQGYLVSRYGFVRWFWDVFSRKKVGSTWEVLNGSDAEDAIAFLPANDAHGHIQDNMVILEGNGFNEAYWLVNMIHDALLYLIKDSELDDAIPKIKSQMELPSMLLTDSKVAPNGLVVAVDVKLGQSWEKMKGVK